MKRIKYQKEKQYSLYEAISDISFIAGEDNYTSGNSRQDVSEFIEWAKEFEKKWKNKEWGIDNTDDDYMNTIAKFTYNKIQKNKQA